MDKDYFTRDLTDFDLEEMTEVVKHFLKEMAFEYHIEIEQWSLIDGQPSNVGFDYLAQMLVSLVTGWRGTGTAARGVDIIIPRQPIPPSDRDSKRALADMRKLFAKALGAKTESQRDTMIDRCTGLCDRLISMAPYHECEAKFVKAKLCLLKGDVEEWDDAFDETMAVAGNGQGEIKSVNEIHCTDVQRWHAGSKDLLSWKLIFLVRWDLTQDERLRVRIGIPNMDEFREVARKYFANANIELGQTTPWDLQLRPIGRQKCHCSKCNLATWEPARDLNVALALRPKEEERLNLRLILSAIREPDGEITIETIKDNYELR